MIGERAGLTKGELECCTLSNRAAIKQSGCIGCDRVGGSVLIRPRHGIAGFDCQGARLKARAGNGYQIAGFGEGGVCVALMCLVGAAFVVDDLPPNKLPKPV